MNEPTAKRPRSAETDSDDRRCIELDMRKYAEWVRGISSEGLVSIFEIGLKVKESAMLTVDVSHFQNVLEKALFLQMEQVKNTVENTEKEVKSQLQMVQKGVDECRGQLGDISRSMVSSNVKGSVGEKQVMNVLKDHFSSFTITKVSTQPRKGYILVETQRQHKIMIEVKNRESSNVPQNEVDRFKTSLESSPDVKVGILFSMKSGIANKASNGKFQVKFDEKQYQIYVPNAGREESLITWSVLMADELSEALHGELRSSQIYELEGLYREFEEIKRHENTCRSNLESLDKSAKSLKESMTFILQTVDKTKKKLKTLLDRDATAV